MNKKYYAICTSDEKEYRLDSFSDDYFTTCFSAAEVASEYLHNEGEDIAGFNSRDLLEIMNWKIVEITYSQYKRLTQLADEIDETNYVASSMVNSEAAKLQLV